LEIKNFRSRIGEKSITWTAIMRIEINTPYVRAQDGSGLKYLRGVVQGALEEAVKANENLNIPTRFLPSSGREIAFAPLFLHSAIKNRMNAVSEVQVTRKKKKTAGRLDMAIFSVSNGSRGDLLEMKSTRSSVRKVETGLNRIEKNLKKAKDQLKDIEPLDACDIEFNKVSVVVQNITIPEILYEIEEVVEGFNEEIKEYFKSVKKRFPKSLIGVVEWGKVHKINTSPRKPTMYSVGMLVVAARINNT
jgi:hypothetical protein